MNNPIVILGSSRSQGNTRDAIQLVVGQRNVPIIDLNEVNISAYDYEHRNAGDDFAKIVQKMVLHHPVILATPVYWYTMSAIMKTFVDRFSDWLENNKESGRQMRGKTLYIISSYSEHPGGINGFEPIFQQTCEYLGIKYGGCYFHYSGTDERIAQKNKKIAKEFAAKIFGL
ncbi:MAG: flavodoxin family protein [Rickettsiales bacterium]